MSRRPAMLAGRWYPADEAGARREVVSLLGPEPERTGIGGIVPHAGWTFSGAVAARVLQALAAAAPRPELVLLFGTHLGPSGPARVSLAEAFETPLGPIAAARELARRLAEELSAAADPADRYEADNTVEVQLPILKHLLPEAELVVLGAPASAEALGVGRAAARAAAETGRPVAVVGSTDLTHYGPNYGFSPKGRGEAAVRWVEQENDARLVARLLALDPEGVLTEAARSRNACCPGAAAAAIAAAKELGGSRATLVEYRTSYAVQPNASFVGYAGVVISGGA